MEPSPVGTSPALERVLQIPQRTWTPEQIAVVQDRMTEALRSPQGTQRLFPHQALALYELGKHRRGFGGKLGVGSGKTLISFLAARVVYSVRPLILVPGDLMEKTLADLTEARRHWVFPTPRVMSYERLSLAHTGPELEAYNPDLIVADECHEMKNIRAGRVKKLGRYMEARAAAGAAPVFLPLTGTITTHSVRDFAHLAEWSLGAWSPLPTSTDAEGFLDLLDLWGECLDTPRSKGQPRPPGALLQIPRSVGLPRDTAEDDREWTRRGFAERLAKTPGVVAAHTLDVDAAINVVARVLPTPPGLARVWEKARAWERPDGKELVDTMEVSRLVSQLACGFYYRWVEDGPQLWMEARKAWASRCRVALEYRRDLDTPAQVQAIAQAEQWDEWLTWCEVRGAFEPETEPVWIDRAVVDRCLQWAAKFGGVVWSPHRAFGVALEEAGLRYFGAGGLDRGGALIDHCRDRVVAASDSSCATGHNLQHWHQCLTVLPRGNGAHWEQKLGRFHRPGQRADEVRDDVLIPCLEAHYALSRAVELCERAEQLSGVKQKLIAATRVGFESRGTGPAWTRKGGPCGDSMWKGKGKRA